MCHTHTHKFQTSLEQLQAQPRHRAHAASTLVPSDQMIWAFTAVILGKCAQLACIKLLKILNRCAQGRLCLQNVYPKGLYALPLYALLCIPAEEVDHDRQNLRGEFAKMPMHTRQKNGPLNSQRRYTHAVF